jgi:hypothetical protein
METNFVFHKDQTVAAVGETLLNPKGNLYVSVGGTFTGTVVVQGKQGDNWFDINVIDLKEIENKKTITAPGAFAVVCPEGFEAIRCNLTEITSGAATITGRLCS